MLTWANKVKTKAGSYTVKEASDIELVDRIAPISHGFVNLYSGDTFHAWCGVSFAEALQIDSNGNYLDKAIAKQYLKGK